MGLPRRVILVPMSLHGGTGPLDPEGGPSAYLCFLLSLGMPGAGQLAGGAPVRGAVMLALTAGLAGAILTGTARLPSAEGFDARDGFILAALFLLWFFVPYDAWFRVRERRNGMLPHLPRTPRVAFLADTLWGGAGRIYLLGFRGLAMALIPAVPAIGLALTGRWPWLAALALVNGTLAWRTYGSAVRLYHETSGYRACHAALDGAPFASSRAPSPSLPLATVVAALIALIGGLLLQRTASDLARPSWQPRTGHLEGHRFVDPVHRIDMRLPAENWIFRTDQPPRLLHGRRPDIPEAFSLAVASAPLFLGLDRVPAGALTRFAVRQETALASGLVDFRMLSRTPLTREVPGLRLVFESSEGGKAKLTVQEYLLAHDRILVLTLTGPDSLGSHRLVQDLDRLAAGLSVLETGT